MSQNSSREEWVDYVKVIACVLVVVGHFYQSMVKANVLNGNHFFQWFDQTIYFFHVPLFFICSGYLYQRYSRISDLKKWKANLWKKTLSLGIPYFVFSTLTWLLKTIFAGAVNEQTGNLFQILFVQPSSPYWYLYCLWFVFFITPTFNNMYIAVIGIGIAGLLKIFSMIGIGTGIFLTSSLFSNLIWFVIGMVLCMINVTTWANSKKWSYIGICLFWIFMLFSIVIYRYSIHFLGIEFILGCIICIAIVLLTISKESSCKWMRILAKYTMPIFLMHTMFAACFRSILLKIGITNSIIHVLGGVAVSFIGPMVAAYIMERIKWLDFLIYPTKYIKRKQ